MFLSRMVNKFRIFIKNLRNTYGFILLTHKYLSTMSSLP